MDCTPAACMPVITSYIMRYGAIGKSFLKHPELWPLTIHTIYLKWRATDKERLSALAIL